MKRIVISIVILSLIALLCCWSVFEATRKTDGFVEKVGEVEKAYQNGDTDAAIEVAGKLRSDWERFMNRSILINDLGHAVEITTSIADIYSFAQSENEEEVYAACDRAEVQLGIFKAMQLPTVWKIL